MPMTSDQESQRSKVAGMTGRERFDLYRRISEANPGASKEAIRDAYRAALKGRAQ